MVLSDNEIKEHIKTGSLTVEPLGEAILQPSSIDLPIGQKVWQVAGMPNLAAGFDPDKFIEDYTLNHFNVEVIEPTLLVGGVYLVELQTSVKFPEKVWGYINPKSSAGRIDLHCVVLARGSHDFNVIPAGYSGKLYMLIVPQSFPVRAFAGQALAQMRIYDGQRTFLTKEQMQELHKTERLVANDDIEALITDEGLHLHLDLKSNPRDLVAVRGGKPISLKIKDEIDPKIYFREKSTDSSGSLFLEPGEFILAATIEKVRIPPTVCAEMVPYRQEHGELRSHYAGFFDPGFGYGDEGTISGASVVCEIRNIGTVPIFLSHGQLITTFRCEYLPQKASASYGSGIFKSNYQSQQGIKLAKFFKPWEPS
ncbi:MAG: hypothetical protein A3J48_01725 [Candidatus Doudnabacteria bacterium RIFCSPHIGHO2_02_FULL_46_11]|uniref:2'-deoxycytidine 5'-triphosphate deaminase n=1 Tax=Candidatus Doudnabacteria bacterium RIFCSPHIGHO2_02_FULL_46_11 TaxID=1817832 RepID=A0A1F5PAF0_9BACT|nr:MAG: hypothetical protein A3J48_01725 [Candidatus Doudnabacteria bacterium RIFCSPHIGHO2_02_FULL_46_11]